MGERTGTRRVDHPVLRLRTIAEGGTREHEPRVFCRYRQGAVAVAECERCARRDVAASHGGIIRCDVPVDASAVDLDLDREGEGTSVAILLEHGSSALTPETTIGTASVALQRGPHHSMAVVDACGTLVGVLHEAALVVGELDLRAPVTHAMSSPLALPSRMPVRSALRVLAAAHLREAIVVDDDGVPLGVFRDVDGLLFVARRRGRPPP